MRSIAIVVALMGAAFPAAPVAARTPMYAHKAGVTSDQKKADEAVCIADAQHAMRDPTFRQPYMYNPTTEGTVAGSAGAALARGLIEGIAGAKRFNTTLYDCMVARGYTMRRMSKEDWHALKALAPDEREARASGWSSASEPVHPEVSRDEID